MSKLPETCSGSSLEEKPWNLATCDPLNEPIHRGVELRKSRQFVRGASGDHQVGSLIKLVSPESGRTKRLLLEIWTQVMVESARQDKDSRSSPAQRHDCRSLMSGAVNTGHDDLSTEHRLLGLTFNHVELRGSLIRTAKGQRDGC